MTRARAASLAVDAATILAVGAFLFPILWVFLASVTPELQIMSGGLAPRRLTGAHYASLLARAPFRTALGNSLIVATASALVATAVALPAAYSLARFRYAGRETFGLVILAMKMMPSVVLLVPMVVIFRRLDLTNTLTGLVVAHLTLGVPVAVWMLRGFVADIPASLEEAAAIDGCSRLQAIRHVVLPLTAPALIVVGTFAFTFSWGEYVLALSLTTREELRTLPLALQALFDPYQFSWGEVMAGGVCIALPVLLLFLVFQRHLVGGLLAGSTKG